jgi:hypothetical protein
MHTPKMMERLISLIILFSARQRLSVREIARMYCYDAWDDAGNCCVILTARRPGDETNFKTFKYQ